MSAALKKPDPASTDDPHQLREFLASVLPARGHFAVWGKAPSQNHYAESPDDFVRLNYKMSVGKTDRYFSTASFTKQDRSGEHVLARKCLHLDIDCGAEKHAKHPDDTYATKAEGKAALHRFITETGLTPTYVIDSGAGLHSYWAFNEDIDAMQWVPLAKMIKAVCAAKGLLVDKACTTDIVRLLRVPGSLHQNGRTVKVLVHGKTWSVEDLTAKLTELCPAPARPEPPRARGDNPASSDEVLKYNGPPARIEPILAACGAMREGSSATAYEPLWRAMLGVVKHCEDGNRHAHELSANHPDYDPVETEAKLDGWKTPPATCAQFSDHSTACSTCEHKGKITSPIALGRVVMQKAADSEQPTQKTTDNEQAKSAAAALAGFTASLVVFLDHNNAARLEVPRPTGRVDAVPADSGVAFDYILAAAQARTSKAPAKATVENILAVKRAEARSRGDIRRVHNRIAPSPTAPGGVLIDLANAAGQVAQVDAHGVTVLPTCSVHFTRGTGTGELPQPATISYADAFCCLQNAFVYWGVTDPSDRAVLVVVLCEWLRPNTPKPLLEIVGPAGAAKSTIAEHLIKLVDPTPADRPPSFKIDEANLMAATRHRYALHLDNASRLTPDEQDLLCRVATGGAISHRALYTQGDTFVAELLAPVVITAITRVLTRSDARSRTITVSLLARTSGHRSALDVAADFRGIHGALFSSVCSLLRAGLAGLPAVRTQTYSHRMVDLEQLGEAIYQALGKPRGWFSRLLAKRRQGEAQRVFEDDATLRAIVNCVVKAAAAPVAAVPSARTWAGPSGPGIMAWTDSTGGLHVMATMSKLMQAVRAETFHELAGQPSERVPQSEKGLRDFIAHRQPTLKELGWAVEITTANDRSAARFGRC